MAKFRKIWFGLDLRNNKLINAKTNTPTDSEHIAPKSYVDINTTYDTSKAQTYQNPPKFPWITNVYNKSFKQIFDELFFPVIYPTYTNPSFNNMKINVIDEFSIQGGKKGIFEDRINKFRIDYKISASDRVSGIVPKIIIVNNSNTTYEFNGTETSDTEGFIEWEFLWRDIQSITLRKVFEESSTIKNTNYGVPYIPVEFTINYNLDFDVLNFINKNYLLFPPILYRNDIDDESIEIIDSIVDGDLLSLPVGAYKKFVKDRQFIVDGDTNLYIFGIPEPLYNKSDLILHIGLTQNHIDFSMLSDNYDGSETGPNIKTLEYFGRNIKYFFGVLDLGYYTEPKKVNLQFNLHKS